jgi:hypothetical protein
MTDNVVNLNGEPVEPNITYDGGLVDLLERAIADVKQGRCTGVGIIQIGPHATGFEIDCSYQGPRLSLISGAMRLIYKLNKDLDRKFSLDHPA